MRREERKAAVAAWRERKRRAGVFAWRCPAENMVWVGATPTLDSVEARLRFGLRSGDRTRPAMARAFARHGDAGFAFEVLETLDDDVKPESVPRLLKGRKARWVEELGAEAI